MKKSINTIRSHILSETSRGTAILGIGNIISAFLAIVFTIIVARFLGPEKWGSVAVAFGLAAITQAIFDLGMGSALFRFKADKHPADFSRLLLLRMTSSLFAGIAVFFFLPPLQKIFLADLQLDLALLGSLAGVVYLIFDFFVTWEQSKRNYLRSSAYIIGNNLLRIGLIVFIIFSSTLTARTTLFVYFLSPFIFVLYFLFVTRFQISLISGKYLRKTAKFSAPLGLNRMIGVLSGRIDTLLVFSLLSSYEAGIYGAAKQLAFGVPLLVGSLATVIASRYAHYQGKELKKYFTKTIYLSLLLSVGLLFGAAISPLVIKLFGQEYHQSGWLLRYLLLAMVPFVIAAPSVNLLIYGFGKSNIIALNSIVILVIVYFGNLYLIPLMGVKAVVLVQWISNMYLLVACYVFALKYLYKK